VGILKTKLEFGGWGDKGCEGEKTMTDGLGTVMPKRSEHNPEGIVGEKLWGVHMKKRKSMHKTYWGTKDQKGEPIMKSHTKMENLMRGYLIFKGVTKKGFCSERIKGEKNVEQPPGGPSKEKGRRRD